MDYRVVHGHPLRDCTALAKEFGCGYSLKKVLDALQPEEDYFVICGECGENIMDCDGMHLLKRKEMDNGLA